MWIPFFRSAGLFQSLSGFPMSCNDEHAVHRRGKDVFQSYRVSNELQRTLLASRSGMLMFQSLSGFPMSCNMWCAGLSRRSISVSIPIGFSNELQPEHPGPRLRPPGVSIPIGFSNELQRPSTVVHSVHLERVSIPIGFSNELQPLLRGPGDPGRPGFNPYRVFQ